MSVSVILFSQIPRVKSAAVAGDVHLRTMFEEAIAKVTFFELFTKSITQILLVNRFIIFKVQDGFLRESACDHCINQIRAVQNIISHIGGGGGGGGGHPRT